MEREGLLGQGWARRGLAVGLGIRRHARKILTRQSLALVQGECVPGVSSAKQISLPTEAENAAEMGVAGETIPLFRSCKAPSELPLELAMMKCVPGSTFSPGVSFTGSRGSTSN